MTISRFPPPGAIPPSAPGKTRGRWKSQGLCGFPTARKSHLPETLRAPGNPHFYWGVLTAPAPAPIGETAFAGVGPYGRPATTQNGDEKR